MNNKIDNYLSEGCGRCVLGGTPECKVHKWTKELLQLRRIVLDCGLTEELKWSVPCYTHKKKNILIISAFKDYAALSFFKGALLQDRAKLLEKPGDNSQAGRLIKFKDFKKILENEPRLKAYIFEAIEVENEGLEVPKKTISEYHVPEELEKMLQDNPDFKAAFEALTPGRQKGYLLHFSQAKQSKTRLARIEKCMPKIYEGKGFNDK
ncbi:YdeI/OmpD-associated family protein [Echinicola marina]|uniref:YdeI/OmpD-associated family protein n=1 Tax=Echinicola marina TaxID=2859768 RepID=UPI001CF6D6E9|nr:YdeI/OmpD-associated family protein [Echinicola marina]UCS92771.1 YdeI/OmpD-associated family protein [Echinicola marina]